MTPQRPVQDFNGQKQKEQIHMKSNIALAAEAICEADALLIGAGAGMGVDSGLPDFRGNHGFWEAYPMLHGRPFAQMSTPHWFHSDPALAWGFFGHRLNLYRDTVPHEGFQILRRIAQRMPLGGFVFTSNVDGQFQKAGFAEDGIEECHGSIHHLQCSDRCTRDIWSAKDIRVDVDESTLTARGDLPCCPSCGAVARPNIMMFDDGGWIGARTSEQYDRRMKFLRRAEEKKLVAIELGAGCAIPTVRMTSECYGHPLIRINPREYQAPHGAISIGLGALEALRELDLVLAGR